jgi:phospholipid/cholesterol/gamma-HCH transport system ATP-binding protein
MNSVLQIGDNVTFVYKGQLWWKGNKQTISETKNPELIEFLCASELTKRLIK